MSDMDCIDQREAKAFADCFARAERVREGYWSPFAALAWIVSRDDRFVAAVQLYEVEYYANRGGPHSSAAWVVLGSEAGRRYGITYSLAEADLREAAEAERLQGGIARPRPAAHRLPLRPIDRREWNDWCRAFEFDGLSLIPGLVEFAWPSEAVRAAFPRETKQSVEVVAAPSAERWQKQRVTKQQETLFRFFDSASTYKDGEVLSEPDTAIHARYLDWSKKNALGFEPYKRTAFEKMLDRYRQGWRVGGCRWILSQ